LTISLLLVAVAVVAATEVLVVEAVRVVTDVL
jgi:hypothetical protein